MASNYYEYLINTSVVELEKRVDVLEREIDRLLARIEELEDEIRKVE